MKLLALAFVAVWLLLLLGAAIGMTIKRPLCPECARRRLTERLWEEGLREVGAVTEGDR